MKRLSFYSILFLFLTALMSCQKSLPDETAGEIVLQIDDDGAFAVDTKASAVTSMPSSLYWGMTYSNGSVKQSTTSKSVSSNQISTGYYQTVSPTTYIHYVSNWSFTAGGDMSASNSTDIIAGSTSSSSTNPAVTLNHIFARTGTFTCYTQSGYSISNVQFYIKCHPDSVTGTSGTFNMGSMSWTATSARINDWTAIGNGSDLYLIPGTYRFRLDYTLSLGDYSQSFSKRGEATLVAGKVNNIYCTASGGAAEYITLGVSLTGWSSQDINMSIN